MATKSTAQEKKDKALRSIAASLLITNSGASDKTVRQKSAKLIKKLWDLVEDR